MSIIKHLSLLTFYLGALLLGLHVDATQQKDLFFATPVDRAPEVSAVQIDCDRYIYHESGYSSIVVCQPVTQPLRDSLRFIAANHWLNLLVNAHFIQRQYSFLTSGTTDVVLALLFPFHEFG